MTAAQPPRPIYKRPEDSLDADDPFVGDSFGRRALARRLTTFVERMPDGAVVSIDAPWGEGKTWFGRRWSAQLALDGYRTAYVNCFQLDHIEDPFLIVAGELLEVARKRQAKSTKLLSAGKKLGAALLPTASKLAIGAAGHWLVGDAEAFGSAAKAVAASQESAGASIEKFVGKRLEKYEADKQTVAGFRSALAELAAEEDKPIVVFIDELDRCRPDFAIRMVERVKHFFDVPRIVFVLLMNRTQLAAAARGVYGPAVDADAYLAKFIQVSLTLPKARSATIHSEDDNRKHLASTLAAYGLSTSTHSAADFIQVFGVFATAFDLSLRDIERAVVLFSISGSGNHLWELAWPIALKLARPELFARLRAGETAVHEEASSLAKLLLEKETGIENVLKAWRVLHASGSTGFSQLDDESGDSNIFGRNVRDLRSHFARAFGTLDLEVES